MTEFDLVDLGTKLGQSMKTFLNVAESHRKGVYNFKAFKGLESVLEGLDKKKCVGFERPQAASYEKTVRSHGFDFKLLDLSVLDNVKSLPTSKFYCMFHFLEHLPNKEIAGKVVEESLSKAKHLVWYRLPSFEQDKKTGEGVLRDLGLRFTWTNWAGHPCHWLVEDCLSSISRWGDLNKDRPYDVVVKPGVTMKDTADARIVPIQAPVDVQAYSQKEHGPKPFKVFKEKVIAEFEILVRFK